MRFRFDALFTEIDPVVAAHSSRGDADASLAALRRAGYGRDMLAVVGQGPSTPDIEGMAKDLGSAAQHWAASGVFWGMLWTAFIVMAVFLLPAGGMAFAALLTMGALALVLQTAVVARVVRPERDSRGDVATLALQRTASGQDVTPWSFLVVVRGSRSDIALARAILVAH